MNNDAGRGRGYRDYEEPAFPPDPRRSPEPPLSVGTWTGDPDDRRDRRDRAADRDRGRDRDRDRDRDHGTETAGDDAEDDGLDLGPAQMVEAAVPRARGARRVLPGDAEDDSPDDAEDPDDEDTVRTRPRRGSAVIAGAVEEAPPLRAGPGSGPAAYEHEPYDDGGFDDGPGVSYDEPDESHEADDAYGSEPTYDPESAFAAQAASARAASGAAADPTHDPDHESDHEPTYETPYEPPESRYSPSSFAGPTPGGPGAGAYLGGGTGYLGTGTYPHLVMDPVPAPSLEPAALDHAALDHTALDPVPQPQPPQNQLELRRGRHTAPGPHQTAEATLVELRGDRSEPRPGDEARPSRGPFEIAVLLGAPAIALTALLYYFGWARSAAMADFLGFDEDVLDYSTKEYLLRSVDTLYRPMLAVVGVLLAARMLHPHVLVRLRRHRRAAARLSWLLRCAWFAVPAATWTAAFRWPGHWPLWWPLLLPCALTAGVLVSAYGVLLSRQLGTHRRATGMGVRPWSLSVVLTASAVVLCLFWTLGAYAQADGRATGLRLVRELPTRTAVVVYSANDLRVTADQGVTVETLTGRDSPYRYRYAGLRLLRHADGRLFLLPDRWSWDHPRLIVVREDAGIRAEYMRTR
ncbi:MAG: hypothetical protein HOV68_31385 [Streptomycetaceae bacterium]|nr:hypothetical protein [Streptomycetaceae bacterium]